MTLVAGVDTSTQSCKVLVFDAESGALIRQGSAKHPDTTECHPDAWWAAFEAASAMAGGLGDVGAISVGGQQHGMARTEPGRDYSGPVCHSRTFNPPWAI